MDIQTVLERAAERLAEDESLRSNLDDQQASAALQHALRWLEKRLGELEATASLAEAEQEIARATRALRTLNTRLDSRQLPDVQHSLAHLLPLSGALPGEQPDEVIIQRKTSLIRRALDQLRAIWRRSIASNGAQAREE